MLNEPRKASVFLLLLTAALFLPALHCGFFNLDDPDYVTQNALVRQGITPESVLGAFRTPTLGNWTPLVTLSYQLDWTFFGTNPAGYHLTSILFHALNSALLLLFIVRLGLPSGLAFVLGALFAWHPLRVESVVWIAERKDVLSGLFFLAVLHCHLSWQRSLRAAAPAWIWYGLAVLCHALGLMSKPMLVTTPGVLLLLDLLLDPQPAGGWRTQLAHWRTPLLEKLPLFGLSLAFGLLTIGTQRAVGASAEAHRSLLDGLCNALATIPAYLGKIVCPATLVPLYPLPPEQPVGLIITGAAILTGASILACWQWRRRPWLPVGWFWFVGMLLPVAGLLQVGGQFIADRYTYLPAIGLLLALGLAVQELRTRYPRTGPILLLLTCAVLAALTTKTWRQIRLWENPLALWEHTIAHTKNNPLAHLHLANALIDAGQLPAAQEELLRGIAIAPAIPEMHTNLGVVLASTGRPLEALGAFRTAVALGAKSPKPQLNSIRILLSVGRRQEAIATCQAVLARWPCQPDATAMLAQALKPAGSPAPE